MEAGDQVVMAMWDGMAMAWAGGGGRGVKQGMAKLGGDKVTLWVTKGIKVRPASIVANKWMIFI